MVDERLYFRYDGTYLCNVTILDIIFFRSYFQQSDIGCVSSAPKCSVLLARGTGIWKIRPVFFLLVDLREFFSELGSGGTKKK